MKGTIKALAIGTAIATLAGCSSFQSMEVSKTDLTPKWAAKCKQVGSEGFLFWKEDFAYSCGTGHSWDQEASKQQAEAFAMAGFAKRINGTVNSSTVVDITDTGRTTRTVVEFNTKDTSIRKHLEDDTFVYFHEGKQEYITYYRYRMPLSVFEGLVQEAKNAKNNRTISSIN